MKHFEQGNQTYLAVNIEGFESPFYLRQPFKDIWLVDKVGYKIDFIVGELENYSIIGLFPSLTEDECKEMVEKVKHNGGTDFFDYSQQRFLFTLSAKQSLASRLRSMGLNPETTLILKIK